MLPLAPKNIPDRPRTQTFESMPTSSWLDKEIPLFLVIPGLIIGDTLLVIIMTPVVIGLLTAWGIVFGITL